MQRFLGSRTKQESGFTMVEFVLSSVILLLISAALFSIMAESQRSSSYQTEVHAVLDNTRIAMDTVEGYVRQASNNPCAIGGFSGITMTGTPATSVRLQSDLTGGAGCGSSTLGDKGDPDGDTLDAGEDVTISYNGTSKTVEITPQGGNAQPIANYISAFTLQYFDQNAVATTVAADVRKIRITMTGTTILAHPQTKKTFGQTVSSDVQIATR